jgi:ribonuclease VapC
LIVDTSAIVSVFFKEIGYEDLTAKLEGAERCGIGTPTLFETSLVLSSRWRGTAVGAIARFVDEFEIEAISFEDGHWHVAADAYERYGKGRHRASLNFGDCMSYAVAKLAAEPLLCIGNDFALTDIEIA